GASCELFDELVMDVERLFHIVVEQMRCRLEVGSRLSVGLCRCQTGNEDKDHYEAQITQRSEQDGNDLHLRRIVPPYAHCRDARTKLSPLQSLSQKAATNTA